MQSGITESSCLGGIWLGDKGQAGSRQCLFINPGTSGQAADSKAGKDRPGSNPGLNKASHLDGGKAGGYRLASRRSLGAASVVTTTA